MVLDEEVFEKSCEDAIFLESILHPAINELIVKPEGKKSMSWEDFVKGYLK